VVARKGIKLVIADLDGTLVKTKINWDEIREKVRSVLGISASAPLRPLATALYTYYRSYKGFIKALMMVEEAELKSVRDAEFHAELPKVLSNVRAEGIKVAIVTLRSWRTAKPLLDKLGIIKLIDMIVTRDVAVDRRSQLLEVLRKLNLNSHEALFIGDWEGDFIAGISLGIKTFIVKDFNETIDLLVKLTSIK